MPNSPNVTLNFSGNTYTTIAFTSSGALYVPITLSTNISFTSIIVTITPWRNPSSAIDCTMSPVFNIFVYSYKFNNIIVETHLNNVDCLTFNNRLFDVSVSGNSILYSGAVGNYLISLTKAADGLTITPTTTSSAITFDPPSIIFNNFSDISKAFIIKTSASLTGNFSINFTKT
jgi:hypothetical protein